VRLLLALGLAAVIAAPAAGRPQAPISACGDALHGRVVLDNYSTRANLPAVTFDHWRHRAMYTCRVCHVDLEFALEGGETQVSATSNEAGLHCGACHDGKTQHDGKPIFRSCSGWPRADAARGCTRCHTGASYEPGPGYQEFKRRMPLDSIDYVDWESAERRKLIKPLDTVEGVPKRQSMKIDRDVTIHAVGTWLQNVTFSHKKHAVWNGCELCHPEIFPVTKRGSVKYGMSDISAGQYCGVCHLNVAFPLDACHRCHSEQERRPLR
jgi:c(7)-type cytochrome triheme protein